MLARKTRFSVLQLFVATAICAFLVASAFMPAGYLIHLPILVALILFAALWTLVQKQRLNPAKLSIRNHWQLMTVIALILSLAVFYFPMYGFLIDRDSNIRTAKTQREAAINMPNPNQFRKVARELHRRMMECSPNERLLLGSSSDVPLEIAAIEPISIVASENYLFIKMSPNGAGLVIYPEGSTFGRVTGVNITRDVYYWGK